jgi:hypothetical protein
MTPSVVELMRRFPPPNFTVRALQRILSQRPIFTARLSNADKMISR